MSDTELLDLIPFFEGLAKVDNVYTVLKNANSPTNHNHNLPGGQLTISTSQSDDSS